MGCIILNLAGIRGPHPLSLTRRDVDGRLQRVDPRGTLFRRRPGLHRPPCLRTAHVPLAMSVVNVSKRSRRFQASGGDEQRLRVRLSANFRKPRKPKRRLLQIHTEPLDQLCGNDQKWLDRQRLDLKP